MKTMIFSAIAATCLAVGASAQQVNIVYPQNGATYPISDPAPGGLSSHYMTFSFSVECQGGPHQVRWMTDTGMLGEAQFYDMISVQQVWKMPGGGHSFEVNAGRCGADGVKYRVGN